MGQRGVRLVPRAQGLARALPWRCLKLTPAWRSAGYGPTRITTWQRTTRHRPRMRPAGQAPTPHEMPC